MSFVLKTWVDRVSEFSARRTLTKEDGTTEVVTVTRNEGEILSEGDAFSAENMNDLENRISEGIDGVITTIEEDITPKYNDLLEKYNTLSTSLTALNTEMEAINMSLSEGIREAPLNWDSSVYATTSVYTFPSDGVIYGTTSTAAVLYYTTANGNTIAFSNTPTLPIRVNKGETMYSTHSNSAYMYVPYL